MGTGLTNNMNIDPKVFDEKNYTNPKFIPVTNKQVIELHKKIQDLQKKANPFIERFQEIEDKFNEIRKPLADLEAELLPKLKEYKSSVEKETQDLQDELEKLNQQSSRIQEKMQPIVHTELDGKLAEFEDIVGVELVDNVLHYKIQDRLEEVVKNLRKTKTTIK